MEVAGTVEIALPTHSGGQKESAHSKLTQQMNRMQTPARKDLA
jgi:hypothetical protein